MQQNQVREQMGAFQLQFFEFNHDLSGYRYANSTSENFARANPVKWNQHKKKFLHRKFVVAITTQHLSAAGKSGSTYQVHDILAVVNNPDELKYFSEQYWTAIRGVKGDEAKAQRTCDFIRWMHGVLCDSDMTHLMHKSGLQTAHNLYLSTVRLKETA